MQGQVANSVDQLHLSSVAAVEFDWVSVGNELQEKLKARKQNAFY